LRWLRAAENISLICERAFRRGKPPESANNSAPSNNLSIVFGGFLAHVFAGY
jgi:hypothetical protein